MIRTLLQAAILVLAAVALGVGQKYIFPDNAPALYLQSEPLVEGEILAADAWKRAQSEEVAWIDARSEKQFAKGHVPGALQLNEQTFDADPEVFFTLQNFYDKPVFIYCDGAACKASHKIAGRLRDMRFAEVVVVKDGWPGLEKLVKK